MRQLGDSKEPPHPKSRGRKVRDAAKGVLYGMAAHGHVTAPVIPPYYALKILPYAVPNIKSWKQRVSRERDFTDQVF